MNFVSEQFKDFLHILENITGCTIIMPPPEQWSGGGMHKICKMYHKEIQTNSGARFAFLQIRSTLVNAGLPSQATMLFYRPIRALLLLIGKEPININNDRN